MTSALSTPKGALKAGAFDWDAFMARADAGQPEPGIYTCAWCGRDDCLMFTERVAPEPNKRRRAHRRVLGQFPAGDVVGVLWCPCCSLKDCQHKPVRCPVCGLCTNPEGSFYGGGPFTRCDGPGAHSARVA